MKLARYPLRRSGETRGDDGLVGKALTDDARSLAVLPGDDLFR